MNKLHNYGIMHQTKNFEMLLSKNRQLYYKYDINRGLLAFKKAIKPKKYQISFHIYLRFVGCFVECFDIWNIWNIHISYWFPNIFALFVVNCILSLNAFDQFSKEWIKFILNKHRNNVEYILILFRIFKASS